MTNILLFFLCLVFGIISIVIIVIALVKKPRIITGACDNVLILAAHQDDCIILAGEYAVEAARSGSRIEVVYLTCGDVDKDTKKSLIRRHEAESVWKSLGVSIEDIHFLDLPQSPLDGPLAMTAKDINSAKVKINTLVDYLPTDSAVFLPAAGESHCDHRALRGIIIEVLEKLNRHDLNVFEAAEYNNYFSLRLTPMRSLIHFIQNVPILRRWNIDRWDLKQAGFVNGPGKYWILPPDKNRVERKKELLRKFSSEDGELLIKYFGYSERYRLVKDFTYIKQYDEHAKWYIHLDGYFIAPSLLMLWLSFWLTLVLLGNISIEILDYISSMLAFFIGGVSLLFLITLSTRYKLVLHKLTILSVLSGIVIGLCLI